MNPSRSRRSSPDRRPGGPAPVAARILLGVLLAGVLALCSCERGGRSAGAGPARPRVVCTTGMIGDAVRRIAGDDVELTVLMGEGVDPHLYKASPNDIRVLSDADLILYNGLHLEGRMGDVLVKLASKRPVHAVTDSVDPALLRSPTEFEGDHDPHIWFDVSLWTKAVHAVGQALIDADPARASEYESRAAAYITELEALHRWCGEQLQTIPESRRVLITAHDAFGYFARAYHIEVRAIQGVSTDSEAGIRSVNELVDFIVARGIPAVFVESSVPRKTIEALVEGCTSRGHAVRVGGELYSDAMGAAGTPEGTYVGMVRHNVTIIVAALSAPDSSGGKR